MTVRRMSAQRAAIFGLFRGLPVQKRPKNRAYRNVQISPKAEVVSSNLAGRAISDQWRKCAEVKRNIQRRLRVRPGGVLTRAPSRTVLA
jgi:hypothetical protein